MMSQYGNTVCRNNWPAICTLNGIASNAYKLMHKDVLQQE